MAESIDERIRKFIEEEKDKIFFILQEDLDVHLPAPEIQVVRVLGADHLIEKGVKMPYEVWLRPETGYCRNRRIQVSPVEITHRKKIVDLALSVRGYQKSASLKDVLITSIAHEETHYLHDGYHNFSYYDKIRRLRQQNPYKSLIAESMAQALALFEQEKVAEIYGIDPCIVKAELNVVFVGTSIRLIKFHAAEGDTTIKKVRFYEGWKGLLADWYRESMKRWDKEAIRLFLRKDPEAIEESAVKKAFEYMEKLGKLLELDYLTP